VSASLACAASSDRFPKRNTGDKVFRAVPIRMQPARPDMEKNLQHPNLKTNMIFRLPLFMFN
jgi:hypothetical protein